MADLPPPLPPERLPLAFLYVIVPGEVFRDERLSDKAKWAYGLLSSVADPQGYCEPRVSRIAASFTPTLSIRHTRLVLTELVATGWIERTIRAGPGDPRASNLWRLTGPLPTRRAPSTKADPRTKLAGAPGQIPPGTPDRISRVIERDLQESSPSSGGRLLSTSSTEFSPEVEEALAPYLAAHHFPARVRQEIHRALAPISHGHAATPDQVIVALHEMQANGVAQFHSRAFRGYLTRAQEAPPALDGEPKPPAANLPPRRGRGPGLGDRMADHRKALEADEARRQEEQG